MRFSSSTPLRVNTTEITANCPQDCRGAQFVQDGCVRNPEHSQQQERVRHPAHPTESLQFLSQQQGGMLHREGLHQLNSKSIYFTVPKLPLSDTNCVQQCHFRVGGLPSYSISPQEEQPRGKFCSKPQGQGQV